MKMEGPGQQNPQEKAGRIGKMAQIAALGAALMGSQAAAPEAKAQETTTDDGGYTQTTDYVDSGLKYEDNKKIHIQLQKPPVTKIELTPPPVTEITLEKPPVKNVGTPER